MESAEDPGRVDVWQEAAQALQLLLDELDRRLHRPLDERDLRAVTAAVQKAIWRGVHLGVQGAEDARRAQAAADGLDAYYPVVVTDEDEPDPWAERYGEANDDD